MKRPECAEQSTAQHSTVYVEAQEQLLLTNSAPTSGKGPLVRCDSMHVSAHSCRSWLAAHPPPPPPQWGQLLLMPQGIATSSCDRTNLKKIQCKCLHAAEDVYGGFWCPGVRRNFPVDVQPDLVKGLVQPVHGHAATDKFLCDATRPVLSCVEEDVEAMGNSPWHMSQTAQQHAAHVLRS